MSYPADDYQFLVGTRINKAKLMFPGMWIRVVKRDGEIQAQDTQLKANRVNVETEKGYITKVIDMG